MSAKPNPDHAQRFAVTIFADTQATRCRGGVSNIDELIDAIDKSSAIKKGNLPLFKLATFGDKRTASNCLRHDENVVAVSGCEGDYDAEKMTLAQAYDLLEEAGVETLLYSTPSSEPDAPRFRVMAPFANPVTGTVEEMKAKRAAMVKRLDNVLGGVLASESYTLSQSFYFGRLMGRPPVLRLRTEGKRVDEMPELDSLTPPKTPKSKNRSGSGTNTDQDHDSDAELVRRVLQGDHRHNAVRALTARYVARGMGAAGIVQAIHGLMDGSDLPRDEKFKKRYSEVSKLVEGAFDKGYAPSPKSTERPVITVRAGRITEAEDAVAAVIAEKGEALGLYVNNSRLVKPYTVMREGFPGPDGKREAVESLELVPRTLATFRTVVNRGCAFEQWRQDKNRKPYAAKVDCPKDVAQALFEAPDEWTGWPRIERMSETPLFDGKQLHCGPGLVGATWVRSPDGVVLAKTLKKATAAVALTRLRDYLREFPFATSADEAAAVALFMTAGLRTSLGAAPGYLLDKNYYGTGASTLGRAAGVIALGRAPPVLIVSKNKEEFEKMLGAALMQARPVIALDNVSEGEPLRGKTLTQMLTEPHCEPRVLGVSRNVVCDTSRLVFATGVNIVVMDDLVRRFLKSRMESKLENPADRRFERPNLIEDIRNQRVNILSDIFTITACYLRSGTTVQSADLVGFDQFVRWVAKPLVWLGLPDIIQSSRVAKAANPDDVLLGRILPLWKLWQAPRGATVHEFIHFNYGSAGALPKQWHKELMDLMGEATNARTATGAPELSAYKVSRWIGRMEGRVRSGVRFKRDPRDDTDGVLWKATGVNDTDDVADASADFDAATDQTVAVRPAGNSDFEDFADELSIPLRETSKKCSSRTGPKGHPRNRRNLPASEPRGNGGRRK
jgi:hypothetical protein